MARYIDVDAFIQDYEPLLTWELLDALNEAVENQGLRKVTAVRYKDLENVWVIDPDSDGK